MWKLIKLLFLLAIVATLILWFADIKVRDRTLKERVEEFKKTELYQEGIKDIRSIVGESLKALGEEISGEVTDKERAELEKVIKQEMMPGTVIKQGETSTTEGALQWQQQQQQKQQPLKALPSKQPAPASPTAPLPAR